MGCSTAKNEITTNQSKRELTADEYKAKIQKLTDNEIYKMIVEDFDQNGEKEAFVLVRNSQEGDEGEFELWFLNSSHDEKIVDRFIASNNTSIELLDVGDKYILFNKSQVRQNDYMQSAIYGVTDNKAVNLFSQNKINLFIEENELYAYSYSYSVLEPEFREWMSLSEQKYHFRWDSKLKTCKEYEANIISEDKFMTMSKAKELKEKIHKEINEKYTDEVKEVEYVYLLREDETVDINVIVTTKEQSKYKYHITVSYRNGILGTYARLFEGNKEKALIKYLNKKDK